MQPAEQQDLLNSRDASSLEAEIPAAPDARVGWGFVFVYALAYAGTWLALLTPVLVTIALRVRHLAAENAAENLSLVLGVGALFALVGNPLFGQLSDRTTSRFGMRRPWLIGGVLSGSAALMLIASADSIAVVLLGWCLAQLAFNAVLAAIVALLPDQVPLAQRGAVAGVLGMCMPIGQVGGTFLVHAVSHSTLLTFMAPAAVGVTTVLLLTLILPDRRLSPDRVPASGWREFVGAYWISPRRHPDFAWAWLSRFLLVLGTAFLNTYQPFYLVDHLGFSVPEVPGLVFNAMLVQASMIVVFSLVSGRLSDFVRRRKIFVLIGASIYASGLWIVAAADSYPAFLVGMAVTGMGHGVYFAVDLALVTDVLPDRQHYAAKDLGVLNVANALPQSAAPAIATAILAVGHGDYTWLFLAAGAAALLGSFAILPLKSVR
jgi:MFS family permease